MNKIDRLEEDIKSISIQGATNIALATVEGIKIAIDSGEKDTRKLKKIAEKLAYARPTESLAQNAVRYIFPKMDQRVDFYLQRIEKYKSMIKDAKEKMGQKCIDLIENGGVYMTHCHSSTVVSMFLQARKKGKNFSVLVTETRPKFQGRITAVELLNSGIDVTLIIDDVAESIIEGRLKHIDKIFIGGDVLSQKGFINKVGSLGISKAAEANNIPIYSLSILLKYDPRPYSPVFLEERSAEEVWSDAPKGLKIYAPAFDFVRYDTGVKIICEKGILAGEDVEREAINLYPFIKES